MIRDAVLKYRERFGRGSIGMWLVRADLSPEDAEARIRRAIKTGEPIASTDETFYGKIPNGGVA